MSSYPILAVSVTAVMRVEVNPSPFSLKLNHSSIHFISCLSFVFFLCLFFVGHIMIIDANKSLCVRIYRYTYIYKTETAILTGC